MKVLKYAVIALIALIVLALGIGFLMPDGWQVERSLTMSAKPEAIHPLVANLKSWPMWMPWMEGDPSMTLDFEGADGMPGSKMSWKSEKNGNGALTVTSSDPARGVEYSLMMAEFSQPARGSITFQPEGAATRVTWKDAGTVGQNPIGKLFRPLLERILASHFDKGLAKLKVLAEAKG